MRVATAQEMSSIIGLENAKPNQDELLTHLSEQLA